MNTFHEATKHTFQMGYKDGRCDDNDVFCKYSNESHERAAHSLQQSQNSHTAPHVTN